MKTGYVSTILIRKDQPNLIGEQYNRALEKSQKILDQPQQPLQPLTKALE